MADGQSIRIRSFHLPLMATDSGSTLQPNSECRFLSSLYPEMAMQAAKKVMCHRKVKHTAKPL